MDLAVRDHRLTERVGAVTLAVLVLLAVLQMTLSDCNWHPGFRVTVYFEHLGGLREGGAMQVAGRVVGRVESISLVPAHQTAPGHPLYPGGGVSVRVRIEDRHRRMTSLDGDVFISTRGSFGQKYLEMSAAAGTAPRGRPLSEGDVLRGVDPPHLDRVLVRSWNNLQLTRRFVAELRPEWNELVDAIEELGATLQGFEELPAAALVGDSMRRVSERARALEATLAESGVTGAELARLSGDILALADKLDGELSLLRARMAALGAELERARAAVPDGVPARLSLALARADGSLARARHIVATARELAALVRGGQGTVGALWNDPEFPEHAKSLGRLIKKHPWLLIGRGRTEP